MGLDNPVHIVFIVVVLLLVFGAKRLPEIGRSLGTGMREFKSSVTGEMNHNQTTLPAGQQQAPPPQAQAAQAPVAQPVTPVAPAGEQPPAS